MPDINEWEHLQSTLMRVHNRIVRESFRDDLDPENLTVPENALRHACLIKDTDTVPMVNLRMTLFYNVRESGSHGMPPIFSVPDFDNHESNKGRPQVILLFSEKTEDWKRRDAKRRKQVRVSYRITNKDSESITIADLKQLATKINTEFPRTWSFKTGKYRICYKDKSNGWFFIVSPYTVSKGKELISKVMALDTKTPDWEYFSVSEHPDRNYKARRTVRVLGKTKELSERRPIANVFLDKVEVNLRGNVENTVIIDRAISHRIYGRRAELIS